MTPKITGVMFYKSTLPKFLAEVSIQVDGVLVLYGLHLGHNQSGYFLKFPTRFNKDRGMYLEMFHPLSSDFYQYLLQQVVTCYQKESFTWESLILP